MFQEEHSIFWNELLPVPQQIVRGVPIKVVMPLNQVGVYNTFKNWEAREPEILDWITASSQVVLFLMWERLLALKPSMLL